MTRYESAGTWFDPAEAAKRAGYLPTWDNLRITFGDITFPVTLRTWEKDNTVTKHARIDVPGMRWVDPQYCTITTPAGATANADEAALAVDALGRIARDFTPSAPGSVSSETRIKNRIRELHGMIDVHRRERDEARAQHRAALRDANAAAEVGAAYLRERDEARAERDEARAERDEARAMVEILKRELRAVGAQCEPFQKPAPAVTKDTVVTMGMLQGLYDEAREERTHRSGYELQKSPIHTAIDRKLAGK